MTIIRILIVVALQTVALAYMILDRQAMLNSARTVTLKVVPVDPNDMFRGEYVILSYDISRLETAKVEGDDTFEYNDTVYVTLVPGEGDLWKAAAIARAKPAAMPGGVVIKGKVRSFQRAEPMPAIGPDGTPPVPPQPALPQTVSVDYGIESYFVPQGTGKAIEDEARAGELSVEVAVDDEGRGAIKAIRRKGQRIYVEGIL